MTSISLTISDINNPFCFVFVLVEHSVCQEPISVLINV